MSSVLPSILRQEETGVSVSGPLARLTRRMRSAFPLLSVAAGVVLGLLPLTPSGALYGQVADPLRPTLQGEVATVVVDSIVVEGNAFTEASAILATFGIPLGQPITWRDLQEGQRRLWESGRFADFEIAARGGNGAPVILTLRVEERVTLRNFVLEGLRNVSNRAVRDSLGIPQGFPVQPDRIVKTTAFIRESLATKGIPFARIEVREVPVSGVLGQVDLFMTVDEGARVAITDVRFVGNEVFSDAELRSVLNTKPEGFLWFRTGQFEQERLDEDLGFRLPEFYASSGYLDFTILGDTLIVDHDAGKALLEIRVSEGPQYQVASFAVEGNRVFPTSQLETLYRQEEGGLLRTLGIVRNRSNRVGFDQPAFFDASRKVGELYRNRGYLYSRVSPVVDRLAVEPGSPPLVDLRWVIEEGPPAYIRRIYVKGNTFTHDRVIREQVLLLPGQIYSEQDIIASWQRIQGLGFFETPGPIPDIRPDEETGDVDVVFEVVEKATGSVNFGTSFGGLTGVSGFLGYEQPNLFGQAKSGSLRWDFGRYQNNFQLTYSDPALRQSRVSGSVSIFDSRDRLFSFSTGERKRRGFLTRFGIPIPRANASRLFAGYSLSRTDYRLRGGVEDQSLFGRPPGTQSQISLGIRRRTLNSPLFPTVGSEQSWTMEVNGGLLGGDGNFTRHLVESSWWIPTGQFGGGGGGRPVVLALGLRMKGGAVVGNVENFPFDRFWLGGVQFGEMLRGYDETTITPLGYFDQNSPQITEIQRLGDAFLVLGAEYALRLNDNISVSTFYEAGNVWKNAREIDPSRLFRGAGVGLQLVTPFGPIGIDYAYGFDRLVPGWQLHFRMGGLGAF